MLDMHPAYYCVHNVYWTWDSPVTGSIKNSTTSIVKVCILFLESQNLLNLSQVIRFLTTLLGLRSKCGFC